MKRIHRAIPDGLWRREATTPYPAGQIALRGARAAILDIEQARWPKKIGVAMWT
ncbi:MAG TPA: hypothetical protein VF398_00420 [bacterium]